MVIKGACNLIVAASVMCGSIFVSPIIYGKSDKPGRLQLMADGEVVPSSPLRSSHGNIIYSRRPKRVNPHMDFSRMQTNADFVLPGPKHSSDIIPFTGKGVIIGVVDGGIDPGHPAFLNSQRTATRIKKYILTRSSEESKSGFLEADIFDTPEKISAAPADNTCEGHGTHTASIAAGAWNGNDFYGMAPDAELVLVSMGDYLYDDEIIYGMNAVAEFAIEQAKPCTMNFSIGTPLGPHDGTGLFSLAAAKASEQSGAIIVASSGNDGGKRITIDHDFSIYPDTVASVCWNMYGTDPEPVFFEAWSSDNRDFEIALIVVNDFDDSYCFATPFYSLSSMGGDGILTLLDSENPGNSALPELKEYFPLGNIELELSIYLPSQRCRAVVSAILPGYVNGMGKRGRLGFMIRSEKKAHIRIFADGFTFFGSGGRKGFSDAIRTETISDLSIGNGIISVGSTNTLKDRIINLDGDTIFMADYQQYGNPDDYTLTSSYGTSFDDASQIYPHVLAPGAFIVAAYNAAIDEMAKFRVAAQSYNGKTQYWGQYTGTSMSSPAVAGIIALWLEANPNLTYQDIIEILQKSSDPRNFHRDHGDVVRYGLIDAYQGLKLALASGASTSTIDPEYTPRLMMRQIDAYSWECVVAGAQVNGTTSVYSADGRLVSNISTGNETTFNITLPTQNGIYFITVPTSKGLLTSKIAL